MIYRVKHRHKERVVMIILLNVTTDTDTEKLKISIVNPSRAKIDALVYNKYKVRGKIAWSIDWDIQSFELIDYMIDQTFAKVDRLEVSNNNQKQLIRRILDRQEGYISPESSKLPEWAVNALDGKMRGDYGSSLIVYTALLDGAIYLSLKSFRH